MSTSQPELWVDKYQPKKVEDIIGNKKQIETICNWLNVFNNPSLADSKFRNGLLISGPPGLGKTTTAHILLRLYGFDVIEFNASELRTSKLISEKLDEILSKKSIKTMMANSSKTGIIMDEMDGIENKKDCTANDILHYINFSKNQYEIQLKILKNRERRQKKSGESSTETPVNLEKRSKNYVWVNKNPIICISNSISKSISGLLKDVIHVKFDLPTDDEIYYLLSLISNSENLNIPDTILRLLVPHCQSDFRRAIYILEYISSYFNNNPNPNIDIILSNIGYKDINIDLFTAVGNIYNTKNLSLNQAIINFENEINFIPFIVHENFLQFIDKNTHNNYSEKLDTSIEYYDNLLTSQLFKKNIFGNWELNDYIAVLTCSVPNHLISHMNLKDTKEFDHFEKSALISKYNYRYYNLKTINNLCKKLKIDINNFQFFSGIIVYTVFINRNHIDYYMELCANHGVTFKDFEKIIKLYLNYSNYEKRYTKKFQKELSILYSRFTIELSDEDNE